MPSLMPIRAKFLILMKMGVLGNQARTKKSMMNYELLLSSVLVILVIIVKERLLSILSLVLARPTRLSWLQESKKKSTYYSVDSR